MKKLVAIVALGGMLLPFAACSVDGGDIDDVLNEIDNVDEIVDDVVDAVDDIDDVVDEVSDAVDEASDVIDEVTGEVDLIGEETESDDEYVDPYADYQLAEISLSECLENKNMITFGVKRIAFVTPEDTDLIEEYGLEPELDGYDYEYVEIDEEEGVLNAFKSDCTFTILDPENYPLENLSLTGDEFCEYLYTYYYDSMLVYYKTDEDGFAIDIVEQYMP